MKSQGKEPLALLEKVGGGCTEEAASVEAY